jgi:methylmalonyl-CoA mutase
MSDTLELSEFAAATRVEWERRIKAILKGRSWDTLRSTTEDGVVIDPLHEPVTREAIETRAEGEAWSVVQRMDDPEPVAANEQALEDIGNGASGLALIIAGAPAAKGFGLQSADQRSIALALKDLPLHRLVLRLEAGSRGLATAEAMAAVTEARSLNPERMCLSFGIDPVGALAAQGMPAYDWSEESRRAGDLALRLSNDFGGPFFEADGRLYHDGGMTPAQELGAVLGTAVEYLRVLASRLDDAKAARAIGFTLAADADMFTTLAKFRAARLLWRRVTASCGLPEAPLKLHGESSYRMMTKQDPHANLLRNVAAIFGAGLGGADSISTLPYSLGLGLPDRFARRMARNAQSILMHEANLHRVNDAAAGSGYVDHLTQALAEKAWQFFQTIEGQGGMRSAVENGFIRQSALSATEKRGSEFKSGKRTIIGVTAYPPKPGSGVSVKVARETSEKVAASNALNARRDAECFESDAGN